MKILSGGLIMYEIGDHVRVCSHPESKRGIGWNSDMDVYCGKIVEITSSQYDSEFHEYIYQIDNNSRWAFVNDYFYGLAGVVDLSPDSDDILLSDELNGFISQFRLKE